MTAMVVTSPDGTRIAFDPQPAGIIQQRFTRAVT
jgi:hypothetical protein